VANRIAYVCIFVAKQSPSYITRITVYTNCKQTNNTLQACSQDMACERNTILNKFGEAQESEIEIQAGRRAVEWRNSYTDDIQKCRQAPRRNARVLVENLFDLQKLIAAAIKKRHKTKNPNNDTNSHISFDSATSTTSSDASDDLSNSTGSGDTADNDSVSSHSCTTNDDDDTDDDDSNDDTSYLTDGSDNNSTDTGTTSVNGSDSGCNADNVSSSGQIVSVRVKERQHKTITAKVTGHKLAHFKSLVRRNNLRLQETLPRRHARMIQTSTILAKDAHLLQQQTTNSSVTQDVIGMRVLYIVKCVVQTHV
jgi:hypothetical protein